jgi:hypothetical protein
LSLSAAVLAEAHRTEVVLATAARRASPPAELAAASATAGMTLRTTAVVAASVVQGLDGEFRKGAGFRCLAFNLGEGRAYQRSPEPAIPLTIIVRNRRRIAIGYDSGSRNRRGRFNRNRPDWFSGDDWCDDDRRRNGRIIQRWWWWSWGRRLWSRGRSLQSIQHLCEQRGGLGLAARRRDFCLLEFVFSVAAAATRSLDGFVDHRHDGMVSNAALAWTIVVQHVAGPIPAVLHATPPKTDQLPAKPYRYCLLMPLTIVSNAGRSYGTSQAAAMSSMPQTLAPLDTLH